jgi:hypothetical protein
MKDNMLEVMKKKAESDIDLELKREFDACH